MVRGIFFRKVPDEAGVFARVVFESEEDAEKVAAATDRNAPQLRFAQRVLKLTPRLTEELDVEIQKRRDRAAQKRIKKEQKRARENAGPTAGRRGVRKQQRKSAK